MLIYFLENVIRSRKGCSQGEREIGVVLSWPSVTQQKCEGMWAEGREARVLSVPAEASGSCGITVSRGLCSHKA